MNHVLPPHHYRPTLPLLASLDIYEAELARHRKTNIRRRYQRRGGLHWLRLGRLTLQWSWRRQP